MYPELQQFNAMQDMYKEKIKAAEQAWGQLHRQKEQSSALYEEMLNQYGRRNSKVTMERLTEAKDTYLRAMSKERDALEILDDLKESRQDRLQEYMKTLYMARDREMNRASQQMETKIQQLERLKAEYLMMIQQIHQINDYKNSTERETMKAIQEFGQQYRTASGENAIYPKLSSLEISSRDIQHVFHQGELPHHLQHYIDGEHPKQLKKP
ncbi:hypothetical protein ACFQPF_00285 [Fictibacillus iocasae]|uniref:Uncharacterized protein n=1 Tax=Fictibacillus iocasae TaxID=2715437 RepID=A0ABW2NHF3_9BACL